MLSRMIDCFPVSSCIWVLRCVLTSTERENSTGSPLVAQQRTLDEWHGIIERDITD